MRSSRPLRSPTTRQGADPITGARAAVWLAAAALGIALGLNVGLPLPHPALAPRGQAQTNQAEVAVLLFPDLEGDGDFTPDCIGCDGRFSSGDRLFAERDPLPRLDVTLTDVSGTELTMHTRAVVPGRQETLFRVDQPGAYTVTLRTLPPEWQLCPNAAQDPTVVAADFDGTTRRATVQLALTRGCRRLADAATSTAAPTDAAAAPAPATESAPSTPPAPSVPAAGPAADDGRRSPAAASGAPENDGTADEPTPDPIDGARSDVSTTPMLPQTGRSGGMPLRRPAGFALLAALAAVLGAGGRQLRRPIPSRSGLRPERQR